MAHVPAEDHKFGQNPHLSVSVICCIVLLAIFSSLFIFFTRVQVYISEKCHQFGEMYASFSYVTALFNMADIFRLSCRGMRKLLPA